MLKPKANKLQYELYARNFKLPTLSQRLTGALVSRIDSTSKFNENKLIIHIV